MPYVPRLRCPITTPPLCNAISQPPLPTVYNRTRLTLLFLSQNKIPQLTSPYIKNRNNSTRYFPLQNPPISDPGFRKKRPPSAIYVFENLHESVDVATSLRVSKIKTKKGSNCNIMRYQIESSQVYVASFESSCLISKTLAAYFDD